MEVFGEEDGETACLKVHLRLAFGRRLIEIEVTLRMALDALSRFENRLHAEPFFFAFHFILDIDHFLMTFQLSIRRRLCHRRLHAHIAAIDFVLSVRHRSEIKCRDFFQALVDECRQLFLVVF